MLHTSGSCAEVSGKSAEEMQYYACMAFAIVLDVTPVNDKGLRRCLTGAMLSMPKPSESQSMSAVAWWPLLWAAVLLLPLLL